jgi:YqeC protein
VAQPSLIDAFELKRGDVVALVGGGGKSSTMLALGRQANERNWSVRLGTTTKVGPRQVAAITDFIHGGEHNGKLTGAPQTAFAGLGVDLVVIEADGARTMPAKAPAGHEPVIPPNATIVISVIGADALDRVIEDQCHRPMRVAAVVGCRSYDRLTPERAAILVTSDRGGRKSVPMTARHAVLITKVTDINRALVDRLVAGLGGILTVTIPWSDETAQRFAHRPF